MSCQLTREHSLRGLDGHRLHRVRQLLPSGPEGHSCEACAEKLEAHLSFIHAQIWNLLNLRFDRACGDFLNPALDSLGQARGVATSPDGNNVYVAGFGGDSITTFDRAAATGQLTEAGRIADAETNDSMKPILGGRRWLRISPTPKSCTPLDAPGEVK